MTLPQNCAANIRHHAVALFLSTGLPKMSGRGDINTADAHPRKNG
jgi:hypothetical protein